MVILQPEYPCELVMRIRRDAGRKERRKGKENPSVLKYQAPKVRQAK